MAALYGKGVWMLYSANVDLAIEMAVEIGATHILYKTAHRAMFFPEAARRVHDRVRAAGLIPFAWPFIFCDDPEGEARVALKTADVGYAGIVFDIEDQAAGQQANAMELGQRLLDAGLNPDMLYYTSFPNITQHSSIPYAEMNSFCKGGFMPQSYPTFLKPAEVVIHEMTYEEHAKWSEIWGYSPPIYPILAGYRDEHGTDRLTPEEFILWANALAEHRPTFFSIYRAGVTDRDLWPVLAALTVPQPPAPSVEGPTGLSEPAPPGTPTPTPPSELIEQPVYVIVQPNDTVWMLCQEHGCTRAQFWEWNGHLWDERGLPRDANYLQAGWRVRVE